MNSFGCTPKSFLLIKIFFLLIKFFKNKKVTFFFLNLCLTQAYTSNLVLQSVGEKEYYSLDPISFQHLSIEAKRLRDIHGVTVAGTFKPSFEIIKMEVIGVWGGRAFQEE